jgi:hypothetical protein
MNKIIKIKTIVGIIVALIIGLLTLLDIFAINGNSIDYTNIYHIAENAPHWMFKSVSNYTLWSILQVIICLVYVGLSILTLLRKPKGLVKILLVFEILVIIWFIRYFYLWYTSGFDHYPGFDPYIF